METIFYCLLALIAGFVIAWLLKKDRPADTREADNQLTTYKVQNAGLEKENSVLRNNIQQLNSQLELRVQALQASEIRVTELITRLENIRVESQSGKAREAELIQRLQLIEHDLIAGKNQVHALQAELRLKNEQMVAHKTEVENIGKQFTREFEVLAQKVLDEKTERFDKHQEKSLADILNPLKENIQNFKKEFEQKYTTESNDRISLREQIKHMMDLNQTLSVQANNLTNALRGQVKQQGNWGEMILESILEYADLQKGLHYFVQEHTPGENGQSLYPDIIVRYPDDRSIVIDSKVSLLHYEQYCSSQDSMGQATSLKSLLTSIYSHIDGLSGKKYQDAVGSLDFVLLFVPVEGAYITIMQSDRDLWQYAYKKRVLLMSPTNLIAAMKLVYDMWKREGINQNAQEIGEKAVKIYEKLASFVEEFEKVGAQLDKAGATFKEAQKKLVTGKGNLLSQASQMRQKMSHNKPVRKIPDHLEDQALLEDSAGRDDNGDE